MILVHENEQDIGPMTREEVVQKLIHKELSWTSYFFETNSEPGARANRWKLILEDKKFQEIYKFFHPSPDIEIEQKLTDEYVNSLLQSQNWHILKNSEEIGPYSYTEMISLLQRKVLFEVDFVKKGKAGNWRKLAETEEFESCRIRAIKCSNLNEHNDVFLRRKFPRAELDAPLLVHKNKEVWRGWTHEVGSGGLSFSLDPVEADAQNLVELGQNVFIHLKAQENLPSFNALASVVSKRGKDRSKTHYGVAFVKISQTVQQAIHSFIENTKLKETYTQKNRSV